MLKLAPVRRRRRRRRKKRKNEKPNTYTQAIDQTRQRVSFRQ
jgi:hypothetical protein